MNAEEAFLGLDSRNLTNADLRKDADPGVEELAGEGLTRLRGAGTYAGRNHCRSKHHSDKSKGDEKIVHGLLFLRGGFCCPVHNNIIGRSGENLNPTKTTRT